jgi:hypothetical protein
MSIEIFISKIQNFVLFGLKAFPCLFQHANRHPVLVLHLKGDSPEGHATVDMAICGHDFGILDALPHTHHQPDFKQGFFVAGA